MSWNEIEILTARRGIVDACQRMLAGKLSYIEGARIVLSFQREAKLPDLDDDLLPFTGIVSETDALPIGEQQRSLWQPAALAALQAEMDQKEAWSKIFGEAACRRLIERFAHPV
ncbi:hypothetical protein [Bradyrhizobium yuanmingense]|uniref:hypothetical protein n=1 Tax=Bradyrhizobium yuanmingense TaxID=108015 RepID=UPI0023B9157F|nr:hypothetical protein [Bradyrhizobium yuanmingense]MDF0494397.1 hypothetical protein [Bradyrhizobium yuanmingense]